MIKSETIGRNDPCPCRSGLKYKKCCGKTEPFGVDDITHRVSVSFTDPREPEVGTREDSVIVKVQLALNSPEHPALVYDRDRTYKRHMDVARVAGRMQGRSKAFFYARFSGGQIVLGDEAPDQAW